MRTATILGTLGLAWSAACTGGTAPTPDDTEVEVEAQQGPGLQALALEVGDRVQRELDCEASPFRYLCPAGGLTDPDPATLPAARQRLLGLRVPVRVSRTLEHGARRHAALATLHLGDGQAGLAQHRPTAGAETAGFAALASATSAVLKGERDDLAVGAAADELLERSIPLAPASEGSDHIDFVGEYPSGVWRTRVETTGVPVWVVVEALPSGGFLSLFPDAPRSAPGARGAGASREGGDAPGRGEGPGGVDMGEIGPDGPSVEQLGGPAAGPDGPPVEALPEEEAARRRPRDEGAPTPPPPDEAEGTE